MVFLISGRITEVQQKRWKVDVNGRLDAVLQLSSVNLPGGELRRRSAEDELSMRKYLQEGKGPLIKIVKTNLKKNREIKAARMLLKLLGRKYQ